MTRMETPSLDLASSNDDKNLGLLLEAFGSKVSLDDMASAYLQAGSDVSKAGEIIYGMLGSSSRNSTPVSNDILVGASASAVGSSDTAVGKSYMPKILSQPKAGNCGAAVVTVSGVNGADHARSRTSIYEAQQIPSRSKPRNCGVSVGTVSGVIGAHYARSRIPTSEVREKTKPVKLTSSEVPASEIWDEKTQPRSETMNKDVEEFVLRMLEHGFQLDMNVIREVIGGCGYDARESVEKLMNISAPTLDLRDVTSSIAAQTHLMEKIPGQVTEYEKKLQSRDSTGSSETRYVADSESERLKRVGNGSNLEKEILSKLFTAPERSEEGPQKYLPRREARTRTYGLVTGPLKDPAIEFTTPIVKKEVNGDENKEDEDNYEALRETVKELWMTMKKYYIAAADAYVKGNSEGANKLLEEGHIYMDKAREMNEKSAKRLLQTRDDGEAISIDVHDYEPKEAIRLLKTQLKSMSGIPSIHYLKVIVGINDDNAKQRKGKRLISKLLERDGIAWTEEQDGQIMSIRVDVIDPKCLSFNQKQG